MSNFNLASEWQRTVIWQCLYSLPSLRPSKASDVRRGLKTLLYWPIKVLLLTSLSSCLGIHYLQQTSDTLNPSWGHFKRTKEMHIYITTVFRKSLHMTLETSSHYQTIFQCSRNCISLYNDFLEFISGMKSSEDHRSVICFFHRYHQ